jgi:uncharacterized membrane protein YgcG
MTRTLIFLLCSLMIGYPCAFAQGGDEVRKFKQEELDQMLAPIALYPDNLLTPLLIAATYPLEVVQAERWAKENKSLKGDALKAALEKQKWDDSVKTLVAVPEVLTMMSEKLEWTQQVGDAFLAQQKEVMKTVQKLRAKAVAEGNLKSSKEQEVKKEGDIIIIQPANPQVVYVPVYNPTVVYGAWWYPTYPPPPVYAYPPGAAAFTFAMGVAVGAAWHNNYYHSDWHGGTINVNRNVNVNISGTRPVRAEQWTHNPQHRQGVAYRDPGTRNKYSPTNRAAVDSRQGNRGYEQPKAGTTDRGNKPAVGAEDRGAGKQPTVSQQGGRDSAFGGAERSSQARQQSDRGQSSRESMRSKGGSSGGGGGRRGGRR